MTVSETNELVSLVESLPIDVRTALVERLLLSLQPVDKHIDELWATEVERRLAEYDKGTVKAVDGGEVFRKIRQRFGR